MADVSFTATAIKKGTNAQVVYGYAGAAVARGNAVYLDTNNEYQAADCTNAAKDAVVGIALNDANNDQPVAVQTGGDLTCDGLTAGVVYVLSAAGAICPTTDYAAATDSLTVIGAASSTTNLKLGIIVTAYGITG